ncbi:MAG: AraC family transcriptional regulator [Fimbriimonas sp.]
MRTRAGFTMIASSRFHFETLREATAGSVSERIPIVIFEDREDNADFTHRYLHADFMSVYVIRQGSGTHFIDGVPFSVQAGDVFAMGIGMSHYFADPDRLVLNAIHFVPTMFSPETIEALSSTEGLAPLFLGHDNPELSRWLRLSPAAHAQAGEMLRDMREEWEFDTPDRALMVQATFLRLLVFLARCHRSVHRTGSSVASRARALIELRYAEPLKIGDLAASAFLSMGRFTELFRAEVGCSPREYLGQVRIQAAKRLLRETDLAVATVATHTGFPDPAYFTRFFRQEVGLSPSEFRGDPRAS